MNFYSLTINSPKGEKIAMEAYKGKAVLIVNTATQCGLTPQFKGLENLHQSFKDQGLVVLGAPCNQFMGQEPLKNEEMQEVCQINHGVTFQLTEKIKVNGPDTHPLFDFLKGELGSLLGKNIKWNFTKFLIDKNGKPYKRYAPISKPAKLVTDIKAILK